MPRVCARTSPSSLLGSLLLSLACSLEACFDPSPPLRERSGETTPMPVIAAVEPAPIWLPELPRGPHAVGYRQQWIADATRALTDPITGERSKRPILLAVWYPSELSDAPDGEAMLVDDYLRVDALGAGPWRDRLAAHVRRVREREVFDGKPSSALAELPTMARRDASWAAGEFPLVLVHPGLGGSFSDNFVLWEHLASHGFVVVSGAFMDASGLSSAIAWDPETSIADFDRMFEAAATWPSVDPGRVIVIGHSFGAQAALAYALAGRDLLAVVSLDSTLEYADEAEPWYEQAEPARYLGRRDALTIPILVFHAGGQTSYVEGLIRSERTLVALPGLGHDDFIAHGGVLRSTYAGPGDPKVRARYVEIADGVSRFLAELTGERVEPLPPGWVRLPAEPAPPDRELALTWIRELGPAGAYRRCVATSGCVAEPIFNDAGYALIRASSPSLAEEVFATIVEHERESWNAWDSWAEVAAFQGQTQVAIDRYRAALERLLASEQSEPDRLVHSDRINALLTELEASSR